MTDRDRMNNLFTRIRQFEFPECESEEARQVVTEIKEGFQIILEGIKTAAKNLTHNEENNQEQSQCNDQ